MQVSSYTEKSSSTARIIMIYISEIQTTAPKAFKTVLQEKVYSAFSTLGIPFQRVDTDEIITMDDCASVDEKLDMEMVKTLFLRNQHKTDFYLFITLGNKPFRSKDFSKALNVARVSFAPAELMEEMLGTKIGAATILSVLLPTARNVKIVIDEEVASKEYYGCSDGTTTGYLKVKTADITQKLLPFAKAGYFIITV